MSALQATSKLAATPASPLISRIAAEFAAVETAADAKAASGITTGAMPTSGTSALAASGSVAGAKTAGGTGTGAMAASGIATGAKTAGGTGAGAAELERRNALAALTDRGLPTSRDENWKYVNLRPLEKVRFAPPSIEGRPAIKASDLPTAIGKSRYVFVDGVFDATLSSPTAQTGITVTTHGASPGAAKAGTSVGVTGDVVSGGDLRFALLNQAFATDGAQIHVARGTDCQICVELVFVATAEAKAGASYPRIHFKVDANARVGLIERHISLGSDANFINCAVDVEVARDSSVQHYRVQQTGAHAIWFDTLTAKLAENAKYQVHMVNLGALSARSTVQVQLLGERSEVGVFGASVGGKNQVHDTFALVEHVAPNARTDQSFRGIAGGRARVSFNGKIVVRKGAHGTDSSQSLRGLLAGSDAEIDVRPQLEIYTDDVRCNHGATAGKLDDNMLFYLLSRGLDRDTALRLLKWAFLEDVVSKIEVPELRRQIEASLAGQLNESAALAASQAPLAATAADGAAHGQTGDGLPRVVGEPAGPAQTEKL